MDAGAMDAGATDAGATHAGATDAGAATDAGSCGRGRGGADEPHAAISTATVPIAIDERRLRIVALNSSSSLPLCSERYPRLSVTRLPASRRVRPPAGSGDAHARLPTAPADAPDGNARPASPATSIRVDHVEILRGIIRRVASRAAAGVGHISCREIAAFTAGVNGWLQSSRGARRRGAGARAEGSQNSVARRRREPTVASLVRRTSQVAPGLLFVSHPTSSPPVLWHTAVRGPKCRSAYCH